MNYFGVVVLTPDLTSKEIFSWISLWFLYEQKRNKKAWNITTTSFSQPHSNKYIFKLPILWFWDNSDLWIALHFIYWSIILFGLNIEHVSHGALSYQIKKIMITGSHCFAHESNLKKPLPPLINTSKSNSST